MGLLGSPDLGRMGSGGADLIMSSPHSRLSLSGRLVVIMLCWSNESSIEYWNSEMNNKFPLKGERDI